MKNLYTAVFKINSDGIEAFKNEKIHACGVYKYEGFEFEVLYYDEKFFQMKVYAYDPYTTRVLGMSVENYGIRVGGQYDIPILIEPEWGSYEYLFIMSRSLIDNRAVIESLRVDENETIVAEKYNMVKEKLFHLKRTTGFAELMNSIERNSNLRFQTNAMINKTRVYQEAFISNRNPCKTTVVSFQENLTLLAAKEAVRTGSHVAVLNFANPIEPGGGVLRGAKAQEENICRSSNLYKSLTSKNAYEYYQLNNKILSKNQYNSMFLGTNQVIYSPDVLILKENVGYPDRFLRVEQYIETTYSVDVITCAAPFFSGSGYMLPNGDLQYLFEKRIRNILEVAIDNEVDVLILGAFGCGAFHNPPDVVADAFREVLLTDRYRKSFEQIVFAVKGTDMVCPNVEAFEKNFSTFPELNFQGKEKLHREKWKWECRCGFQHSWDETECRKCKTSRNNARKVIFYS